MTTLRQKQVLAGMIVLAVAVATAVSGETPMKIRVPAVQGAFYPGSATELREMVDGFLANPGPTAVAGTVRAVIAPHAGYLYSGQVAAWAIRALPETTQRVIILAPSHHAPLRNASLPAFDVFRNALGDVPLDAACAGLRTAAPVLFEDLPDAQAQEHALEVMLPFLQRHLPRFSLVPIVLGQQVDADGTADALAPLLREATTVLVASTDLSHYHPYAEAKTLDDACIRTILARKEAQLRQEELCGKEPVSVVLALARRLDWKPVLIGYRNSGDTAGDKRRVVGYAAIALVAAAEATPAVPLAPTTPARAALSPQGDAPLLTVDQKKELLRLARETILARLEKRSLPQLPTGTATYLTKLGCFVTLHKRGELRGCIGNLGPVHPLAEAVRENAQSAAFADYRFAPVRAADEMRDIDIEISVLTLPRVLEFQDPADLLRKLTPGRHGVILSQGFGRQATFLPQVWEQLPDKTAFLEHLCRKGGMDPDAWKDSKRTEVKTYEALVFGEKEF